MIYICNFALLEHAHKNTKIPKMPSHIKCRMDCSNHTFLVQSITRHNLYSNIVSSLNSLLVLQLTLNGRELPGWVPLNENSVKTIIGKCTVAAIKSRNDIKTCRDSMKKGCEVCHKKESVQIQEMLADFNEEELQKFIQEETNESQSFPNNK